MRLLRRAPTIALAVLLAAGFSAVVVLAADAPRAMRGKVKRVRVEGNGRAAVGPFYVLVDKNDAVQARLVPPAGLDIERFLGQVVEARGQIDAASGKTPRMALEEIEPAAAASHVRQVAHEAEILRDEDLPAIKPTPDPISQPEDQRPEVHGDVVTELNIDDSDRYGEHDPGCDCDECQRHEGCGDPLCSHCRGGGLLRWLGIRRCDHASGPGCGFPGLYWARVDYLLWFTRGMDVPPLATASPLGTPQSQTGVLGQPGTTILFGNDRIHNTSTSGGRVQFGTWLNRAGTFGVEGEYLALADQNTHFSRNEQDNPQLARPFFNPNSGLPDAELVAFPNLLAGSATIDAFTRFQSAGVRGIHTRWCWQAECTDACNHCGTTHVGHRLNFLAGYRFLRLDDGITVTENLTSLDPQTPAGFLIQDRFRTQNEFHGGEIGLAWDTFRERWTLECLAKIAFGSTYQTVNIDGNMSITSGGATDFYNSGLLVQRTNRGDYSRERFAVVPEVGVTLGYRLAKRLWARCGYSFIFWSKVARAGDQIDPTVNPNLLPPEAVPFTGPDRPAFAFRDTSFWAQGVNLGLDYRW